MRFYLALFFCLITFISAPSMGKTSSGGSLLGINTSNEKYSRSKFGYGWTDSDHDGQNTRQEILRSQNTGNLVLNDNGRVLRGRWISAYSGKVLVEASKVDVDHVVPLHWAWVHGANNWSQDEREIFANDQRNLLAVEASLNRQKGSKGPNKWLPPKNQEQYEARFLRIMKLYGLK
jgi:hypothetical protein